MCTSRSHTPRGKNKMWKRKRHHVDLGNETVRKLQINTPRTPRGPPVEESSLKKWIDFLRMRNIQQIICLLSKSELEFFSKPFLKTCLEAGFKVTHVPPNDSDAFRKAVLVMTQAEKDGQRVVVHCASVGLYTYWFESPSSYFYNSLHYRDKRELGTYLLCGYIVVIAYP